MGASFEVFQKLFEVQKQWNNDQRTLTPKLKLFLCA
jgi:hypothetical protein